jgi:ubiquinone/menaquinone biosynthesis C-methylase UbiE
VIAQTVGHSNEHSKLVASDYDRRAADYDRRWRFYTEGTHRETLARLDLPDGCSVLELGCGTGSLIVPLLKRWPRCHLVGVDISQQMLEVARRRVGPEIGLTRADAHILPFRESSFDLIVCCNSFHFLSLPTVALAEMRRVLRRGGRILITDWCDDYLFCKVCDLYLRWFDHAHFRMYGSQECRRVLTAARFRVEMLERYKISWLWGLMTVRVESMTSVIR